MVPKFLIRRHIAAHAFAILAVSILGCEGRQGQTGLQGVSGIEGRPGIDGARGEDGPAGAPGVAGPRGESGPPGADGRDGMDGLQGVPGPPGDPGEENDADLTEIVLEMTEGRPCPLLPHTDCFNANLDGLWLAGRDLQGINFSGSSAINSVFRSPGSKNCLTLRVLRNCNIQRFKSAGASS